MLMLWQPTDIGLIYLLWRVVKLSVVRNLFRVPTQCLMIVGTLL